MTNMVKTYMNSFEAKLLLSVKRKASKYVNTPS